MLRAPSNRIRLVRVLTITHTHAMKLPSNYLTLIMIGLAALLSSCVDTNSTFHLNPDGSGKVEHQALFTKEAGNWSSEDPAQDFAQALIRGAEGIEAWDEVYFRVTGSSSVEFKGVGYFADINKVRLSKIRGGDGSSLGTSTPWLELKGDTLQLHDGEGSDEPIFGGILSGLNDDPAGKKLKKGLPSMLSSKSRVSIVTGGTFSDPVAFKMAEDAKSAEFVYDPKDLDKVKEEDRDGIDPSTFFDNPDLLKLVTGTEAVKVKLDPGTKPLFDYRKAVLDADIQIKPEEQGGWRKLESLD